MNDRDPEFTVRRALSAASDLAIDSSGRTVVLKKLPDDCCQRQQLHPSVKLRLARLRELPMASFVNIMGVERAEQGVVMVSEYVPGGRFDEVDPGERTRLFKEVRLAVLSMHQLGMVHGAIKPANVIVCPGGTIKLIDPSPLLHDDPEIDLRALQRMETEGGIGPVTKPAAEVDSEDRGFRQRALVAAVALAVVAAGAAVAMAVYFSE